MHRTQILIEEWQHQALKATAARRGQSVSQLIRDMLSEYLQRDRARPHKWLREIEGIGDDPDASGREHDRFLYRRE